VKLCLIVAEASTQTHGLGHTGYRGQLDVLFVAHSKPPVLQIYILHAWVGMPFSQKQL
jgi:hypothetical protein